MRSLVYKKMWWVVHRRTNERNLNRDCEVYVAKIRDFFDLYILIR